MFSKRHGKSSADRAAIARSRDENFPVASWLVRREVRPLVMSFYAFARAADDVADNPDLRPQAKLAKLDTMEAGLDGDPAGGAEALALVRALRTAGRPEAGRHARALLGAFRQDARNTRTHDWAELMGYCRLSANPVGRFVLDIHDEDPRTHGPSDSLCTALQVLNHLQDLRPDYERLGRIYLPLGTVPDADLARERTSPALRAAIDRTLQPTEGLLDAAAPLPERIADRRLAGEVRAILTLARHLCRALRRGDPLAERIAPGRRQAARAAVLGLAEAARPRRRARRPVAERAYD